jgi:hypothetical protein
MTVTGGSLHLGVRLQVRTALGKLQGHLAGRFFHEGTMKRWKLLLGILFVFVVAPSAGLAQFLPHTGESSQGSAQDELRRERRILERDQLKLQNVEQRRHIRDEEFQAEVKQWTATVQAWREITAQPPLSEEALRRRLDTLRVFDWERQYQEAWISK